MKLKILQSKRGILYYVEGDGYFFCRQKVRNSKMYLKCNIDSCPVRAITHAGLNGPVTYSKIAHNHPPNPEWPEVQALRSRILSRCNHEFTNPKKIYDEEVSKVCKNVAIQLPFSSISRTMYRRHKGFLDLNDYVQAMKSDEEDSGDDGTEPVNDNYCAEDFIEENDDPEAKSVGKSCPEDLIEEIYCESDNENISVNQLDDWNNVENPDTLSRSCKRLLYSDLEFSAPSSDARSNFCVVCQEQHSSIACIPCCHLCLCDNCAQHYTENICPVCRMSLSPFIKVI